MARGRRPPSLSAWCRSAERAALSRPHPDLEQAIARYAQLTDPARRMALAREIATTRSAELTRAYRNLVMVTAGFKQRDHADGTPWLYNEACVIFVVKRKWAPAQTEASPALYASEQLPSRLLTYAEIDGERVLVAVPTDVQPAAWYSGGTARAASAVDVTDHALGAPAMGTLTCIVEVEHQGVKEDFALSALHVLSPVPQVAPAGPHDALPITPVGGTDQAGRSSPWGGQIEPAAISFDAQLAEITDWSWLRQAFAGTQLSPSQPYLRNNADLDAIAPGTRLLFLAPDNHRSHLGVPRLPILGQFSGYVHHEFPLAYPIRYPGGSTVADVYQRELLVIETLPDCPVLEEGDSGSAVLTWRADGQLTLAGMFIASKDEQPRRAYVIPAWQLFVHLKNWHALPADTQRITPRL